MQQIQQTNTSDTTTPTTPTTNETRPLVKDLDTEARIPYLANLVGKRVRYATLADALPLQRVFHEYATIPWREATLLRLSLTSVLTIGGKPAIDLRTNTFPFGLTLPASVTIAFDQLYDVEVVEPEPHDAPVADAPDFDAPDFDGDDVYEADEVACPHCGHTLRVTMRATLSVVQEEA